MKKYLIERELPGAGQLSAEARRVIAEKSCGVLAELGPDIQWIHSYVAQDKIYCLYLATDEEIVRDHAQRGGFPANRIMEVNGIIDPATAAVSS
ncbi:MAG: DUF4242 domain-containing protein [Gemmatimonadota bacterium]